MSWLDDLMNGAIDVKKKVETFNNIGVKKPAETLSQPVITNNSPTAGQPIKNNVLYIGLGIIVIVFISLILMIKR